MGMKVCWVLGMRGRRVALGALLLALTACDEGPFLQTEEFVAQGGAERYMGGSCMEVGSGSGLGGGKAPQPEGAAGEADESASFAYSFSYEGRDKGMHFQVADGAGRILAERNYSASFIDSGRRDEVKVDVGSQKLRFVHRGVPQCQPIRDPDTD
jgi:hypothetical protein